MQLPREVEQINQQLINLFGIDTLTGLSIWRVVWSDDQFENRYGTYDDITENNIYLRTVTEVRLVPKYAQWIHQKYLLERLVVVPEMNQKELPDSKLSYEPIWVFETQTGEALPPRLDACQFLINNLLSAQIVAKAMLMGGERPDKLPTRRYVSDEETQEGALEAKRKRVDDIANELFGDELGLLGLRTGESIISPGSGNQNNNGNGSES